MDDSLEVEFKSDFAVETAFLAVSTALEGVDVMLGTDLALELVERGSLGKEAEERCSGSDTARQNNSGPYGSRKIWRSTTLDDYMPTPMSIYIIPVPMLRKENLHHDIPHSKINASPTTRWRRAAAIRVSVSNLITSWASIKAQRP